MIILAAYRTTTVVNIWRKEDDQRRNDGTEETTNITRTKYLTDPQAEEGGEAVGDRPGYIISV